MYIKYHKPKNELWNLWVSSNAALATLPHLDIYSHDVKGKAMISSQEHLSFSYGGYSQAQAPISHVTCYVLHVPSHFPDHFRCAAASSGASTWD